MGVEIPPGQNLTPSPPPVPPGVSNKDCDDFVHREDAQADLTPGDPHGLDADYDGIACVISSG